VGNNFIKSQNYIKPEISYINKFPDYSSFKPKQKKSEISIFSQKELPNIKEEESNALNNSSKENGQYKGLFDIIMKELSDIPNEIRDKVSDINIKIFDDKLVKIKKRKRKKAKLSFEQQINKLNVCTYNCNFQSLKFDLTKGKRK